MADYRMCARCVMDTTADEITFNEEGVCSFCQRFDRELAPVLERAQTASGEERYQSLVRELKRVGSRRHADAILGLSGGVDSSYLLHLAVETGLRPHVVHVDMGWNTPASEQNIARMTDKLGLRLHIIRVDFTAFRELQLAFYRAGVRNCEIPQDHAFLAVLYREAARNRVRTILTGGNLATESVLPRSWGYNAGDKAHLQDIHRRFGSGSIRAYPTLGFARRYVYHPLLLGIREVRLLNYVQYNRDVAKEILSTEYGWLDYGPKHFESALTRFFQGYYLPNRFGIDKRKAHLSSLILAGQMTRAQALASLEETVYSQDQLKEDMRTIADALEISLDEWYAILESPVRDHGEFRSQKRLFALKDFVVKRSGLRSRLQR